MQLPSDSRTYSMTKQTELEVKMEKIDTWVWRIFYAALVVTVLVWGTLIVLGVLGVMHFDQIIEFLQGFQ